MTNRSTWTLGWLPVLASTVVLACQTSPTPPRGPGESAPTDPATPTAARADVPPPTEPPPPICEAAPRWRPERIPLPPAFAPSLPSGSELLWFAPGMFDRDADDYFSYVFELALEDPPPTEPAEMRSLLHAYYVGLMTAVAEGAGRTAGDVQVEVVSAKPGQYIATIDMTDEFNEGLPVSVELALERTDSCLIAVVTPSQSSGVQDALARSRTCLPCTR